MVMLFVPYERWVKKYRSVLLNVVKSYQSQKNLAEKELVEEEKVQLEDEEFKEDDPDEIPQNKSSKEFYIMICIAD